MQTGPQGVERRCPDCGALASPDAEWCGQCLRSLVAPEHPLEPASVAVGIAPTETGTVAETDGGTGASNGADGRRTPTWPCKACGNENALELDACAVCGTTFASTMREDDTPPDVDPKDALSASLIFPGLGHRKVGRGTDGLARGVLFGVLAAMAATVFVSGVTSAGSFGVFALFLGAALLVYVGSAWEARHMASGGSPLVSSRALLWATVVIIIGSIMLLALSVVTVARR